VLRNGNARWLDDVNDVDANARPDLVRIGHKLGRADDGRTEAQAIAEPEESHPLFPSDGRKFENKPQAARPRSWLVAHELSMTEPLGRMAFIYLVALPEGASPDSDSSAPHCLAPRVSALQALIY
jgi:hypothetical protein